MNSPTEQSSSPAYALPDSSYPAPPVRHTSHLRLLVIFAVSLAAIIGAAFGIRALVVKPTPPQHCPPDCVGPPIGPPGGVLPGVGPGPTAPTRLPHPPTGAASNSVDSKRGPAQSPAAVVAAVPAAVQAIQTYPRMNAGDGSFSVAYPMPDPIYGPRITLGKNFVTWTYLGGVAKFFGVPAEGLTAQEVVSQFMTSEFPNATVDYDIPNAKVGYQSGFGQVATYDPQSGSGPYNRQRAIVMAAVKNGLALVTEANGPFYWPKFNNPINHGSGANLAIAFVLGYYVNSFRWKGDPPR